MAGSLTAGQADARRRDAGDSVHIVGERQRVFASRNSRRISGPEQVPGLVTGGTSFVVAFEILCVLGVSEVSFYGPTSRTQRPRRISKAP